MCVYCFLDSNECPSTGCIEVCLCFHVPQCVGLDKNLWFSLCATANSAFWMAEGVGSSQNLFLSLQNYFPFGDHFRFWLKCFSGIIIHYGSDFLDNYFQKRCCFQVVELLLHVFLSCLDAL